MTGLSELYGRTRAIELVREFATRAEDAVARPILVFTGAKGCGKTALLDALGTSLRGKTPYARIDCATVRNTNAWEMLSLLAFDLNRNAAGYRSIPFPRFFTAQVAISTRIDSVGQRTRQDMQEALEKARNIDQLRNFLSTLAQDVTGLVPGAATAARYAPNLILNGLTSWRRGRRVVLGEGLEWYGSGKRAYDELVRLNLLTREDASEAERKEATELLWSAFLADLRAAFATRRAVRTWSLNCVLLLDDIDTKPGRLLYQALADARRGEADPLTVVATSSGGVARHMAAVEDIPLAEEASYADYLERRQGEYESDSYPVALRDLTLDEVRDMVAEVAGSRLNAHRAAAVEVYRFTLGHPAATAVVVKAIGDQTSDPASLRALLDARWRGPVDEEPVTVEAHLLRELVGSPSETTLATLKACAAARDVDQADLLADSGLVAARRDDGGLVPADLRVHERPAGGLVAPKPDHRGATVMLPALRNLLSRLLAAEPARWAEVHTWLRDNGEYYYHALALRQIDAVAARLAELLPDSRRWFAELQTVTAAPTNLDTDETDPARILAAAGYPGTDEEPTRTIARVVAALWIANDPLSTADRGDLLGSAAWDLKTLAQRPEVARGDFLKAAALLEARAEAGDIPLLGAGTRRHALTRHQEPVDFTPPVTRRARRRSRIRLAAITTAAALVVGAAVTGGVMLFNRCGEGVVERGGECVGVTDGSYVFDDDLADVESKILAENGRIDGDPHVTVALLTPLRPSKVGSVTPQRVRAQLEGAYVAQRVANTDSPGPKVRLVLANPGSRQQEWEHVVDQLVDSADDDRLVGVIGVGQSTTETRQTARRLADADIPMVASVVTATDFQRQPGGGYIPGFTRVSSTTGNQVEVLSDYLAAQGAGMGMLIYDSNKDDLYTSGLHKEFEAAASAGKLSITVKRPFDGEESLTNQFRTILDDLCGAGAPDTVFYAGRAVLLDDLIKDMRERSCALDRQITLVTGSDASMLRTRKDLLPRAGQSSLAILYAPHVDREAARQMNIAEFTRLNHRFDENGFATRDLDDGWAVMMHDAMLTMSEAINHASIGLKPEEVTRKLVRYALGRSDNERTEIHGAGGDFTLDATTGNAVGRRLPVINVSPAGQFEVKAILPVH
jgi:hypothetical protein